MNCVSESTVVIKRAGVDGGLKGSPATVKRPSTKIQQMATESVEDTEPKALPTTEPVALQTDEKVVELADSEKEEADKQQVACRQATQAKAHALDKALIACTASLTKLGSKVSPWGISKHVNKVNEAKEEVERVHSDIKALMPDLVKAAEAAVDAREKLEHRDKLLRMVRDQDAALQRSNQAAVDQIAKMRGMLARIDGGKSAHREARAAAGGRFDVASKEDTAQMLSDAIDVLLAEKLELQQDSGSMERSKTDLTKRIKELQDKMRDELEVRDRELQTVRAALAKAMSDKAASVGATKEQVGSNLAKKTNEIKTLQRRLDTSKTEVEQAKAQNKASKAAMEQAQASLASSQEECHALAKKLQDIKLQKEEAVREIEHAKAEQEMVFSELRTLQSSGKVESRSRYLSTDAPFPRVAFSTKGGHVLHKAACGNVDTNRCVTFEYENHKQLESRLDNEGLVMCHTCRTDTGF